ncbi:MAG TPA: hypothetical protein VK943_01760 [Arenibaculum sp.]|nr:hypothetical protein [Arenibaculum sp.]
MDNLERGCADGAQAEYGITPDLTTLAKIVAGGLPGGAVAGRADILERLDFEVAEEKGFERAIELLKNETEIEA